MVSRPGSKYLTFLVKLLGNVEIIEIREGVHGINLKRERDLNEFK